MCVYVSEFGGVPAGADWGLVVCWLCLGQLGHLLLKRRSAATCGQGLVVHFAYMVHLRSCWVCIAPP